MFQCVPLDDQGFHGSAAFPWIVSTIIYSLPISVNEKGTGLVFDREKCYDYVLIQTFREEPF